MNCYYYAHPKEFPFEHQHRSLAPQPSTHPIFRVHVPAPQPAGLLPEVRVDLGVVPVEGQVVAVEVFRIHLLRPLLNRACRLRGTQVCVRKKRKTGEGEGSEGRTSARVDGV